MVYLQLFFWILSAFLGGASLLMAIACTPPEEVVSNLSKWAEYLGIHRIPQWARERSFDTIVNMWAKRVWLLSFVALAVTLVSYFHLRHSDDSLKSEKPTTITQQTDAMSHIPFSDEEVYGMLRPANHPTPPNGCDRIVGTDAMKIFIGDNGIALNGYGKINVLEIGQCEALSVGRSADGT